VILDEDIRERESGASSLLLAQGSAVAVSRALGVALTLLGLHVLLQRWLLVEGEVGPRRRRR